MTKKRTRNEEALITLRFLGCLIYYERIPFPQQSVNKHSGVIASHLHSDGGMITGIFALEIIWRSLLIRIQG